MKKLLVVVSLVSFFSFQIMESKAQNIYILNAVDTFYTGNCMPDSAYFDIYGTATGYTASDSVLMNIDFGDGTFYSSYSSLSGGGYYMNFYTQNFVLHNYAQPGSYNITFKVTAPDGKADSVKRVLNVPTGNSCQKTISIYMASYQDSTVNSCSLHPLYFYVNGKLTGYTANDSVDLRIDYGDGESDVKRVPVSQGIFPSYYNFGIYTPHTYNTPGNFSVRYIATASDGKSDTVFHFHEIIVDTICGNVSGYVYVDENNNCVRDNGDWPAGPYVMVEISHAGNFYASVYTDSSGYYSINLPVGYTYDISILSWSLNNNNISVTCPSAGINTVSSFPSAGNDFGLSVPSCPASDCGFKTYISGTEFRPGFTGSTYIGFWNYSCNPFNGKVKMIYDTSLVVFDGSSFPPDQISADTLVWNLFNLAPFFGRFDATQYFTTKSSDALGEVVHYSLIIERAGCNVSQWDFSTIIGNSWDPNLMQVSPQGTGTQGYVAPDTGLTYTIHFQNTGNADAYNISIIDTLDSDLDLETLQFISSSHPVKIYSLGKNIVKFSFNNIMLPDSGSNQLGSQGYIAFSISQKLNLPDGTTIYNRAGIYFDYNPAVYTNTVVNTIGSSVLSVQKGNAKRIANIYPNPSTEIINIDLIVNQDGTMIIKDMFGNEVINQEIKASFKKDISSLPSGLYMVVIKTEDGIQVEKLSIY